MARTPLTCVAAALVWFGCGNDLGDGAFSVSADAAMAVPSVGGLPCDVSAVLSDHCQTCHGATLAAGAPMHLLSYSDLVADRRGEPTAQRCLERMQNPTAQMPPLPASSVTAAEIATFQAWVTAGMPSGDCTAPGDGPFDGPPVCTSGQTWTAGNSGSPLMHPGVACIACHATTGDGVVSRRHGDGDAPIFRVAGTVYPTGHEPDDCDGATGASVEVTDATGAVTMLAVNAAGNFFSTAALPAPIHVAVVSGGKRRAMAGSPPTGDCNSCHTQTGANLAPGRIVLP